MRKRAKQGGRPLARFFLQSGKARKTWERIFHYAVAQLCLSDRDAVSNRPIPELHIQLLGAISILYCFIRSFSLCFLKFFEPLLAGCD